MVFLCCQCFSVGVKEGCVACFVKPHICLCLAGIIHTTDTVVLLPGPGGEEVQQAGCVNEYH